MKKNLFTILAVFCVFGFGLVTTVGTGADDVLDAVGVDRTVDVNETVDVELPAITVAGTAPMEELSMRARMDEANCTDTDTSLNALAASIDWTQYLDEVSVESISLTDITLNELSVAYTATWLPAGDTPEITCSFTMSGDLGDAEIPEFTIAGASGTIAYVDLGITPTDLATIESYFDNPDAMFSYCAECSTDFDLEGITSYEIVYTVTFSAGVTGTATISVE